MPRVSPVLLAAPVAAIALTAPALAQQFQDRTSTRFPSGLSSLYTNAVDAIDIDGDGDFDLVFGNGGNFGGPGTPQPLRILVNDGTGVFADESSSRNAGVTGTIRGVAAGDIDDDGDLDLLLSEDFDRQPRLLLNDGAGVFSLAPVGQIPVEDLSSTRAQFGDLDGDGDLDVYINDGGNSSRFGCGQNRIWINDGTGFFTDETDTRHPIGNVCEPMDVILGDLDGDWDLDVRTGNRGSNNSKVYLNDGSGVFVQAPQSPPSDSNCYSYDLGDMDGDGDLDMIGANGGPNNRENLLRNLGPARFSDVSGNITPNSTGDDNDSKFADIDNDGDLDLIVAALYQSREKIFLNNGSGVFALASGRIGNANDATLDIALADFDGDGDYDLVTGQGESGSFVDRFWDNTTGPADTLAPTVLVESGCPRPADAIVVRAKVRDALTSDRGTSPQSVTLAWTLDGGTEMQVPMTWIGHEMYRGAIPAPVAGTAVDYRVLVVDQVGNPGESPLVSFTTLESGPDLNGDCTVGAPDLILLLAAWGPCGKSCEADLDGSGDVGLGDLIQLLTSWD